MPISYRFHQENVLAILLSQVDGAPSVAKRVPSYAAPDIAGDIRRLAMSSIRQRKGNFRCYYTSELVTFTLPSGKIHAVFNAASIYLIY